MKNIMINSFIFISSLVIIFLVIEGILRIKNSDMKNYNIEMWKYSKELKVKSDDKKLAFYHKPSSEAILQSVLIRTNKYGLRGPNVSTVKTVKRRILFLGSSATLGWGVDEENTMVSLLNKKMGDNVEVLNAGVGNYNTVRYVELFFSKLKELEPTDIVIHYFLNDSENLQVPDSNWFLQNSQLCVLLWNAINIIKNDNTLLNYYDSLYDENYIGYKNMLESLDRIKNFAKKMNIRIYFVLLPDLHYLQDKRLEAYYKKVKNVALDKEFKFLDLSNGFDFSVKPEKYWVMPTDAHPNKLAHKIMADEISPFLEIK